ncbi:MAG TPA: bifunctional adenosylcobinamide kinase/adenosylcobinamide-phosphate guanylyltransferase [Methylococcaceae bacterium]|nr:bifunctional adenosylcobinamide kinase/adenosylcobinamide-phosphate guanylyltransferase [Methylococcaceae bacterium]HIA45892.1 bifunctional adenosylcobinamide kinase/adenosylcobinamide-phosphate guanylyltransferase [Methylococcaceae bacterium]HIO37668.1 bifunctional adenosylcobinamide kinase/adenosylcobinamide-phosphate guanylyltransferase [Rhodospirillales bacterium]
MKTLILGGVRSGKSRLAQRLAIDSNLMVTYIATATAHDDEMRTRIASHRINRPSHWQLIEEPFQLATILEQQAAPEHCLLVDCLTLWLTNLLMNENPNILKQERDKLLKVIPSLPGPIIMVSNETNLGVMPLGELSRRFCDEAGSLHQELAQSCDRVILTIAGLPQVLKGELF